MGEHSSHSHHGSHGHHKSHRSKKRGFLNIKRRTGKHILIVCGVLIFALLIGGIVLDRIQRSGESIEPYIEVVEIEDKVSLVGPAIVEWTQFESSAQQLMQKYRQSGGTYASSPLSLKWMVYDMAEGRSVTSQKLDISTDGSFSTGVTTFEISPGNHSIDVYSLFVDTEYYFKLTVEFSDGKAVEHTGSFETAWSPRIIELDGVTNVRDIGGWTTVDGKKVQQGLFYRGCELDGAVSPTSIITDAGIKTATDVLGIKTDLDLRSSGLENARDMLGDSVDHTYYGITGYSAIFTENGKESFGKVFSRLADRRSYPVYVHCTYGADRTGTVCYIMESLLGMSEIDCYREWELTAFSGGNIYYGEMATFRENFKALEGETQAEKAENYLLSAGVTEAEIASIREIFLGK